MPNNTPIMPLIFLLLILLPIKLTGNQLKGLAFVLWFAGGLMLVFRGGAFMLQEFEQAGVGLLSLAVLLALAIGYAKGRFVLSKTSRRNIERLQALSAPQRPIAVYSVRSWVIIALMVSVSIALNVMAVPLLWRGAINLAIGASLLASSLAYLGAPLKAGRENA